MAFKASLKVLSWLAIAFLVMPSKVLAIKLSILMALVIVSVYVLMAIALALLGWVVKSLKVAKDKVEGKDKA